MMLMVGSTGFVGGMITRALLERGRPVRILVRESSAYQPLVNAGAEPCIGDLKQPDTLAAACRGVKAIITTATAGQRGGADTPRSVDLEGNRQLIAAAKASGIEQFIFVSALPATIDHPAELLRAKATTEVTLRESGLTHTIVAANGIMDVMFPQIVGEPARAGRPVTLVGQGRRKHSFIAAADVAAFAVAVLEHPAALNRRIPIGGPQAVSFHDVIAAYERFLKRPIAVRSIAPGQLIPDLPPGIAEFVSRLLAGLETFDSPVDMAETAKTFGVTQTTVDDFVARAASAA